MIQHLCDCCGVRMEASMEGIDPDHVDTLVGLTVWELCKGCLSELRGVFHTFRTQHRSNQHLFAVRGIRIAL